MGSNKVSVKIYGQEYVISGEKDREHIIKVAAYVDNQMHEIARALNSGPVSDLAVLSAVNISDELLELENDMNELRNTNEQLKQDAQHYVQLWDESKKSFIQYKEDNKLVAQQKEELIKQLSRKERELQDMNNAVKSIENEAKKKADATVVEIEDKCKELENNFFDLQMENLQLKKELEKYKRNKDV